MEKITKRGEEAVEAIASLRLVEATRILTVGKPTGKCYVVSHYDAVSFTEVRGLLYVKE